MSKSKILTIEIWVPETEIVPLGDNGRIDPEYLRNLALNYTADVISDKTIIERAERIERQEYAETVRDIVSNLLDEIKSGDIADEDAARDWLHETIDGHHDVIYTHCAKNVLRQSENEDAFADEFGSDDLVRDGSINWSGMAYAALLADVNAELSDLAQYFECSECRYSVSNLATCVRDADGIPLCVDCAAAASVMHFRNIRLFNNAGMDYPECKADQAIDCELRVKTTGDQSLVTCEDCREILALPDETEDSRSAESI